MSVDTVAPRSAIRTITPAPKRMVATPAASKASGAKGGKGAAATKPGKPAVAKGGSASTPKGAASSQPTPPSVKLEPEVLAAPLVLQLLRVAHSCLKSASSQLPGEWAFDARPRRGDPSARTLVCPCGAKLRSIFAVERHLARGDAECSTVVREGMLGGRALSVPASKLSTWQHKHDGGLIPSD
jgi:hypothetical protein